MNTYIYILYIAIGSCIGTLLALYLHNRMENYKSLYTNKVIWRRFFGDYFKRK